MKRRHRVICRHDLSPSVCFTPMWERVGVQGSHCLSCLSLLLHVSDIPSSPFTYCVFVTWWFSSCLHPLCPAALSSRRLAYRMKMGTLPNPKSPKKPVCKFLLPRISLHLSALFHNYSFPPAASLTISSPLSTKVLSRCHYRTIISLDQCSNVFIDIYLLLVIGILRAISIHCPPLHAATCF